jgi:CxxC-x17-CxxC domain-containing protein
MKKAKKTKGTAKKSIKTKGRRSGYSPLSASADQDVLGLLSTLVEKLTSFETKIDVVLKRITSQTAPQPMIVPQQQPAPALMERRRDQRPMYKAICAECRTFCEVPFKPSGDRPVYCQDCYRERKRRGMVNSRNADKPKELVPVYAPVPKRAEPQKPTRAVKKRAPVKKRKKTSRKKRA